MLEALGRRIRDLRKQNGLSQKDLCARAGLSVRFLVQLEAGNGNASVLRLRELASALEVSLVTLVNGLGPEDDLSERIISAFLNAPANIQTEVQGILGLGGGTKLALVGLRGAGKTSVGKALASRLGWPFIELDDRIRETAGMGLRELFEYHGVERYRSLRMGVLDEVLEEDGDMVMEVGGSIVLDEIAYARLKEKTTTVWLRATPFDHLHRVKEQGDTRPMAGRVNPLGELRTILEEREPLYAQANFSVDTSSMNEESVVDWVETAILENANNGTGQTSGLS